MINRKKARVGIGAARWGGLLVILVLLIGLAAQPVIAQNLRFSVPQAAATLFVNEDGTVSLEYYLLFQNTAGGAVIDIVDIGMPTNDYQMNTISATINGQPVQRIGQSEFVTPGIEIHLGQNSIQPGQSGELFVRVETVRGMLFRADTDEAEPYASFQFQPHFYDSQNVTGNTDYTVTLYLPPGIAEEEPRYFPPERWPGGDEPQSGYDAQDRVFYVWQASNANLSTRYVFGSAFPARVVPAGVLLTEVPVRIDSDAICPMLFCLGFFGFLGFTIFAAITGERKRRLQYLPPKVAVEGNGIKRGLTAVEAAIVMQQPMDKILTMILFAVIKKGAAQVVSRDPMKVEVFETLPEDLRGYESEFLEGMRENAPRAQRTALQNMMTGLVKSVSEKMRGFSRKETIAYYQDIMSKAWQQVEQADTPELKMQQFDEAMDWTMLDRRFDERTRDTFGPRPVFVPMWWGRYDPTFGRTRTAGTSTGPIPNVSTAGNRPPQGVSMPNLPGSDFAASMVGGMQSFASNVVGDLTSFTGGVTQKTNPVPKTTSSGGRGGGGGGGGGRSCACACACAGCACACAGGGR
jgi:hypothetical protein